MFSWIVIVSYGVAAMICGNQSQPCVPFNEIVDREVRNYLIEKYSLPYGTQMSLREETLIGNKCFRNLVYGLTVANFRSPDIVC
jgi:hypothetical protein